MVLGIIIGATHVIVVLRAGIIKIILNTHDLMTPNLILARLSPLLVISFL